MLKHVSASLLPEAYRRPDAGRFRCRLTIWTRPVSAHHPLARPLRCHSTGCAGGTLGSSAQATSFQRLVWLMAEVFGVTISEEPSPTSWPARKRRWLVPLSHWRTERVSDFDTAGVEV